MTSLFFKVMDSLSSLLWNVSITLFFFTEISLHLSDSRTSGAEKNSIAQKLCRSITKEI